MNDLKLMFNNAMQYNKEGSLIYNVNMQLNVARKEFEIFPTSLECEKTNGYHSSESTRIRI